METTKLSSKGQVVLPSSIRAARNLKPGAEFSVESTVDGILLRPLKPFPETAIKKVFGSAAYTGPARTIEDMNAAVIAEARKAKHR